MKKTLFITSLVVSNLLYANSVQLEEVTITSATKTKKNIDGVTASVEVVTSEDIKKIAASTLKQVFEKIPSLNAQYGRFPHPSAASKASISIRGVGSNGTLILLDGKRLSGETESPYELNRIPASMIERIEIVKGSMSTLYGSDAIGGVINVITKKATKQSSTLDIKYGSNGSGEAKEKNLNFVTTGSVEDTRYKLFGSFIDTTSYSLKKSYKQVATNPNTGTVMPANPQHGISGQSDVTYLNESTIKSVGTRVEHDINDALTVGLDINYFTEDNEGVYLGAAKFSGGGLIKNTPVKSIDENKRLDISTDLNYIISDNLQTSLKYYRSDYKKRNETTPLNFTGPVNTKFSANVTIDNIESVTTYALNEANLITAGLDYRKETRDSSAINPDPTSVEFITKEVTYKSAFIQDEIAINESLNATLGARYDHISNANNKVTFQAGVVQKLNETTNVRANYAQGYRTPDIAELYVVSPSFKNGKRLGAEVVYGPKGASYDLKPEESQSFEVALNNRYYSLFSEIVLFHTQIKDKIELVTYNNANNATRYYTSENIDKVEITGAELSLDYAFYDNLNSSLNITYLDTKDKATNKELIFTPKVSASLGVDYKITENLSTHAILRYIGKQHLDTQNSTKSDAYMLSDASLNYDFDKQWSVYGGINNIGDKKTQEELGVNSGRYYFVGMRVTF
ncbi:MAG: TonB-dependent receptor [Arcobacteraceae bacterium]